MLGYSVNNLTLMALTLAIGFLVDDAVVFLENVVRRAEAGETILQASVNSAGEISFTILSMTLSLAAVFIPLVFLPGLLGRIFREFSITIIVAIFASGLISLTLTPLMCARVLSERGPGSRKSWVEAKVGRFPRLGGRRLRPLARLVPEVYLAVGGGLRSLSGGGLRVLQTAAVHLAADGRQRVHSWRIHRVGGQLARADARLPDKGERNPEAKLRRSASFSPWPGWQGGPPVRRDWRSRF